MELSLSLPLLADINLHLGIAEDACNEEAYVTARNNLDKADDAFAELRVAWPGLEDAERGLLAAIVAPLRQRYDQLQARIPVLLAVSDGVAEADDDAEDEEFLALLNEDLQPIE
jgi:hypothetical protein